MAGVERQMMPRDTPPAYAVPEIVLRAPEPGDLGWIVHRHAVLYHQEYGWDQRFEGLAADVVARFVRDFVPGRERCWVADWAGAVVGSVFLVREDDDVARLRMLYVEPSVRGHGVGRRLVRACLDEARTVGYRRMVLWTNSVLVAARRIYEAEGFTLHSEAPHALFDAGQVGQTWHLDL
jgi:GNAT superfamily N-acetyltransferase